MTLYLQLEARHATVPEQHCRRGRRLLTEATTGRKGVAILMMLVAPLLFSSNMIFGRGTIPYVAPFTLAFVRWLLVALVLSPALWRERGTVRRVLRHNSGLVLMLGFLGMWVCGGIVYLALKHTTATNGTLIYTTSPVFIILFEALAGGRRIGWRDVAGSLIALAGIVVIVLKGEPAALLRLDFNWGDLLFVAAAIAWAIYSIAGRSARFRQLSNLALLGLIAAAGTLLLLPFAIGELAAGQPMPTTGAAWTGIAGIVVFSSLLAFSTFQSGVRTLGAAVAGVFMYLLPPYGVFLAVTFLGESFAAYHAAGIALALGGVMLATLPAGWFRRDA